MSHTTPTTFMRELTSLLNRHCYENESNTPDYLLADFVLRCLAAFNQATKERDGWYGVHLEPGNKYSTAKPLKVCTCRTDFNCKIHGEVIT
jgi:hypothetical protein